MASATAAVPMDRRNTKPSLKAGSRWAERIAEAAVKVVSLVSIASVLLILVFVGKEALPVLTSAEVHKEVTFGALFGSYPHAGYVWQPVSEVPKYSIIPLFVGTLKVTLVSLFAAVPLSVGAAIYVSEFAPRKIRDYVKPAIELLAGLPSVVIGFFALLVLATWVQKVFGTEHRLNALVAGLGLTFAVCPVIFSISEDALRAVPETYRSAAMALGSTRSQTVLRVLLPAAMPGIAASVVLGFGRAIGETMVVLLASGNAALLDADLGHSTRTVTATIAQELGEVVVGSAHYHVLFMLGALLFLSTLGINLLGERIVFGMRRQLGGSLVTAVATAQVGRLALRPRAADRALVGLSTLATVIILAMLVIVLMDVLIGGLPVISWQFVSQAPTEGMTKGGIFPAIFGTVALTLLMTIVAVPAGVATAVFLTEYAPADSRLARVIQLCISNLAGVPSIVFGLFGLGFFIATVGRAIDAAAYGGQPTYGKPSLIWAALTLSILTLPVVVVATEEALRAVPRELRDGSLALGATKFQTITRVVLPQALGGILTGAILAVSRGAGEVAPIMFTGAAYFLPYLPTHLNDQFMNLGYHVYVLATQSPDVDRTKPLLYGTVLVLLLLTFLLNIVAIAIRIRFRRRLGQAI